MHIDIVQLPSLKHNIGIVMKWSIFNLTLCARHTARQTDLFEQLTASAVNQAQNRPDPPLPHKPVKEAGLLSRGDIDASKMLPQRLQYVEYLRLLRHPCGNASAGTFQDCIAANAPKQLTLDATPTYFFSAVAPLYLRELSSSSKIVMMIREPVERVESLFRHHVLSEVREGSWPVGRGWRQ